MSTSNKGSSSDKFDTEEIFRRALGQRDADGSANAAEMKTSRNERNDRHYPGDRTEPTLDEPPFDPTPDSSPELPPEPWRDSRFDTEPALPPVPSPQPDEILPAGSRPRNFLRWTLVTALTVFVSAAIGLVLLIAPGKSPNLPDSPLLKQLLPQWAQDALITIAGKQVDKSESAGPSEPSAPLATANTSPVAAPDISSSAAATEASEPATALAPAEVPPTSDATLAPPRQEPAQTQAAETAAEAAPKISGTNGAGLQTKTAKPQSKATSAKQGPTVAVRTPTATRAERDAVQAIRAAAPGSVFVQHISLGTMADARAWRVRHPALSQARIVAINTPGRGVRFAVLSGPFQTRKQADAFAQRHGVPPKPWVRPATSLRAALFSSGR